MPVLRDMENASDVREAHQVAAVGEPPGRAEIGGGMTLASWVDEIARLTRELDEERARTAEARELAKRWRDAYEWDAVGDPLPVYNFPWEEKP